MDFEDVLQPQVAAAAAIAAIIASPRVRGWLRQGAVYGLAGTLVAGEAMRSFARGVAGEAMGSFARGVAGGVQQAAASAADVAQRASTAAANAASRASSQADGQSANAGGSAAGASESKEG